MFKKLFGAPKEEVSTLSTLDKLNEVTQNVFPGRCLCCVQESLKGWGESEVRVWVLCVRGGEGCWIGFCGSV